ncbi:phospho-2-dehydro-3-deoxyheptonate aldolase 2, chloroplastic-like protein [Cinnamomum micranthum f. kanehirae]|uniref:Phospho-2-dehydro-3-deoxyheptonate aldolase n=1 Tax=Cinnamomum micranthum f. kanehirae TaxID=337451 RepID=A0A3S3MTY7_9MAGN|nr:phospho-2-dehydro-3-deoxyheptonate aldolase 2, chloroplastic-like protein [Cinnamomum micranthum f. kanehirae]
MVLSGAGNLSSKTLCSKTQIFSVHAANASRKPAAEVVGIKVRWSNWVVDSWKSKKVLQIPEYPNKEELESVLMTIESFRPIVFAGEARKLEERIADAAFGKAFLLQGGDCAESFKEFNAKNIRDTFRTLLQMGVVLTFGGQMKIIKVGRMAGQFAKPRSGPLETSDGVKLPIYQGDIINSHVFDEKARTPDPQRLI